MAKFKIDFEDPILKGAIIIDGMDDAIIGVVHKEGIPQLVYDYDKCVDIFIRDQGMTYVEAEEWIAFNFYFSKPGPIIMNDIDDYKEEVKDE